MMRSRQGFTLVEMLIVAVLGTIIMGAAYQSLIIQERSYRIASNAVIDHDALRVALGVLESELREVSTSGGSAGAFDIISAGSGELVFRAPRGIGFVCGPNPSDVELHVWSPSDGSPLTAGRVATVFADGDPTNGKFDRWRTAEIETVSASAQGCDNRPAGVGSDPQLIRLQKLAGGEDVDVSEVRPGAPVWISDRVTYGLYEFGDGWGLGRAVGADPVEPIILGLDQDEGVVFTYFDANGNPVTNPASIAAVAISATTGPRAGNPPLDLQTHIFLRNN